MHAMNTVCEGLEDFANVRMDTTDQHADASDLFYFIIEVIANLKVDTYSEEILLTKL